MPGFNAPKIYRSVFCDHTGKRDYDVPERALSPHIRAAINQRDRNIAADRIMVVSSAQAENLAKAYTAIGEQVGARSDRRQAERNIADYIERVVCPVTIDDKIHALPEALRECRQHGPWGLMPDGRVMIAWDAKCGCLQLCPDEAREEQKRLAERYLPALMEQLKGHKRVYKAVFTLPNAAPDQLKLTMQKIYRRFRALLRQRLDGRPRWPIDGALCVLEAPLASDGTWNVHLNVVLICDGYLDYRELRRTWHWNVEIVDERRMREITARRFARQGRAGAPIERQDVLRQALLEVIKYPLKTVAEKSDKGQAGAWSGGAPGEGVYQDSEGRQCAPPMTEWTAEAWLTWWYAHKGFRRSRSYGSLFRLDEVESETINLDDVQWCGQVRLVAGSYQVTLTPFDLIPEDKSPKNGDAEVKSRPPARAGPPGYDSTAADPRGTNAKTHQSRT